ncbi:hypothetical protein [Methylobacterium planeticum]|uniref:Uncharacterized protein n=1 Tax=Methylobacterium planeticum TaxID=2615211 RepID=A0A6N6MMV7_9HYPH|nr:hypothetical protein [Methylobacterium planeticum]KAB1070392.1 hypothetical protein F6X51_22695 [Methylobacterium planeticum]
MTNREMAKGAVGPEAAAAPQPNTRKLPPMPAPEDSATPTTDEEPIDSPQPNASIERDPPAPGHSGLSTDRA